MATKVLPTLYKKNFNGTIYFWKVSVEKYKNDKTNLKTIHGVNEGKIKISCRKVLKAGREKTLYEKGIKMAEKKWNDKIKKEGYIENLDEIDNVEIFVSPMLAKTVEIKNGKIKGMEFPLYVQPKLDGFRCICRILNGKVELISRQNLPYKGLPTLKKELLKMYNTFDEKNENMIFDGELYMHSVPFEKFSGFTKRAQNNPSYDIPEIEFRIYDCFTLENMSMSFNDRKTFINRVVPNNHINLKCVRTETVKTLDEFKEYFYIFIADMYEGIMVRNPKSPYEIAKRSSHLQKYKEFEDDEFEIIGFQEGSGVDEKTVIWKCKTKDGEEFNVRPKGSVEHRKQLFIDAPKHIGKLLTVKFQELSEIGVPRFPVGKDIRENY